MKNEQTLRGKIERAPDLTRFQKKVLKVVLDIPRGQVRTYSWVARKAGSPKAARAAGQALGINPYAPHVPCHRVVASDGSIGGYFGGVHRKKELLRQEGVKIQGRDRSPVGA